MSFDKPTYINEERCVCCGCIIPEGRMICWICEHSSEFNTREINIAFNEK